MISFRDTITLARAKLRSKRIMLAITVVVSGLLFGILCGAGIVATGISKSAHDYTRTALNNQYLVKSDPVLPSNLFGGELNEPSEAVIAQLTALQASYLANQAAIAKRLGVMFDSTSVAPILLPDPYAPTSLPANQRVRINPDSPVYRQYLDQLQTSYIKVARNKILDLKAAAKQDSATNLYQNQSASVDFSNLVYMPGAVEDSKKFTNPQPQNSDPTQYGYLTSSVRNSNYTLTDSSLIQRFILPMNPKRQANTAAIPVVITVPEAVALFGKQYGIGPQPLAPSQQITWMKDLQQKLNGTTYTACYRNDTEIAELNDISQAASDAQANKNNPSYTPPPLTYNLPTGSCGAITIKKDTRSAVEKQAAQAQIVLAQAQGTYQAPQHQLFTFVIVGVMPVSPDSSTYASLQGFMSSLLGAQYGAGAIVPGQMFNQLPAADQHKDILFNADQAGTGGILTKAGIGEEIVAFPSVQAARSFINGQGCPPTSTSCPKPFLLSPYGSNYLLADDIDMTVAKGLGIALPIAIIVAGIIIWATMARVIIDSRRETAVFRAIGAKRRDIMAVYLLYSLVVALRIVAFSLVLGAVIAFSIQALYSSQMTDHAKVTYGVFGQGQIFSFIGVNLALEGWLAISIVGISLLAVLPPLIRNVRRSPISDMRDE